MPRYGVLIGAAHYNTGCLAPATPDKLFEMYLDVGEHAAFTGLPAAIEPRAGGVFRAFDGMLSGTILHIEPKTLIVQTW